MSCSLSSDTYTGEMKWKFFNWADKIICWLLRGDGENKRVCVGVSPKKNKFNETTEKTHHVDIINSLKKCCLIFFLNFPSQDRSFLFGKYHTIFFLPYFFIFLESLCCCCIYYLPNKTPSSILRRSEVYFIFTVNCSI